MPSSASVWRNVSGFMADTAAPPCWESARVPNKPSLALLFRQFDDRKSNRSPSDVASAYQGLYEELRDVPRGPAKMAVEGACWYDRNIEGLPAPNGDDQYVRFREPALHEFIRWIGELFSI